MPITKSAKKALRQSEKKRIRNLRKKRHIKNLFKQIQKQVSSNKPEQALENLPKYYKALDKAAKTGLIKKNTAARKKSRAAKMSNKKK